VAAAEVLWQASGRIGAHAIVSMRRMWSRSSSMPVISASARHPEAAAVIAVDAEELEAVRSGAERRQRPLHESHQLPFLDPAG
jgi:hypothetical protein